jgi:hypothetical protein
MAMTLSGSCRCGGVSFSLVSHTPYPYQLCYCTICRKTAGGGGFAINLMGEAKSLKVKGKKRLGVYHAEIRQEDGACKTSTGARNFCTGCGSALWLYDPEYPNLIHPHASAIDTDLPVPPSKVHLLLRYRANWVTPDTGPDDLMFDGYPEQSIEDWHKTRGLWVD